MLTVCFLYNLFFNTCNSHRSPNSQRCHYWFHCPNQKTEVEILSPIQNHTASKWAGKIQTQVVWLVWSLFNQDLMLDAIHDSLFDIRMAFPLFLGGGGPTSQYLESLVSLVLKSFGHMVKFIFMIVLFYFQGDFYMCWISIRLSYLTK